MYNIQFVSNVTGINAHTIRAWEKRYGATNPVRDKNGRRMYSDHEVQKLDILNKLVEIGSSISDIAKLERSQLALVLDRYTNKRNVKDKLSVVVRPSYDWEESLKIMKKSIRSGDLLMLNREFERSELSITSLEFLNNIFSPLLELTSEVSTVKSEDFNYNTNLNAILKSKLIRMLTQIKAKKSSKKKVLVSSGIGTLNELGALAGSIIFSLKGYNVDYVGVNLKSLSDLNKILKPDILYVALGYSNHTNSLCEDKRNFVSKLTNDIKETEIFISGFYDPRTYNGQDIEVISSLEYLSGIVA